jgi:hypothetical protein
MMSTRWDSGVVNDILNNLKFRLPACKISEMLDNDTVSNACVVWYCPPIMPWYFGYESR